MEQTNSTPQIEQSQLPQKSVFSIKNIEFTFSNIGKFKQVTQEQQDAITQTISREYSNLIVKFIPNTTLVHIQFGQPLNQLAPKACDLNLKNIDTHKPEVKTVIVDVSSSKVVGCFDLQLPIVPYVGNQKQQIIEDMSKYIQQEIDNNKTDEIQFDTQWIPYGITFKCIYSNNSWIMTTQSLHKINEATFGANTQFQSVIENIMSKSYIELGKLKQNLVYTFLVAIKNLSFIPVESDNLYILSVQYKNNLKFKADDYLYKKLPYIRYSYIKTKPVSDCGFVHNLLLGKYSQFARFSQKYDVSVPYQSLLVYIGNKQYELMTPVKELIVNFNIYRNKQGIRSDTHVQFDEYIAEQLTNNTKNSYIKQYLQHNLTNNSLTKPKETAE